ncbi:hypothetical protein SVIOM342S_03377 [Streptomyces violaceorubidus]
MREEIGSGITQQGGIVDEVEGPLGWELRAQVPVQLPDGTGGFQVVRFVGVDGPRWFLRGVISGQGAVQPQAAGLLEQIFRDTVVVRGEGPMAPRDPIVLKLPNDAQMVPEGVQQEEGSSFAGGCLHARRPAPGTSAASTTAARPHASTTPARPERPRPRATWRAAPATSGADARQSGPTQRHIVTRVAKGRGLPVARARGSAGPGASGAGSRAWAVRCCCRCCSAPSTSGSPTTCCSTWR